jgi:hypothetical protein
MKRGEKTGAFDVSKSPSSAVPDMSISAIKTSKDLIEQPALAMHENMYIPPLGSSVVISGKSGSGKSTLLANLLLDGRFYGPCKQRPKGWFDKIFLFSPTANGDDVQKSLNIPKKHVFTDLEEAGELLDVILDSQQKKLDSSDGADKVAQFAIIFDDVIGDTKFMNEKAFTRCFYQVRHVNCTTFICTQHFMRVPKVCRLQANFVFFFAGSLAEVNMITDEYAPPMVTRNDFMNLVNDATSRDKFAFLTINNKVPTEIRFRQNLSEIITLPASRKRGIDDMGGAVYDINAKKKHGTKSKEDPGVDLKGEKSYVPGSRTVIEEVPNSPSAVNSGRKRAKVEPP